jgi:hypothetical protein
LKKKKKKKKKKMMMRMTEQEPETYEESECRSSLLTVVEFWKWNMQEARRTDLSIYLWLYRPYWALAVFSVS